MKYNPLNKSYMILAGIVVVMLALVFYMWMDARRLQHSLSQKPEPLPELSKSNVAQTKNPAQTEGASTKPRELPPGFRFPPRPKRNQLNPGETVSGNAGLRNAPLQQDRLGHTGGAVGENGTPLGNRRDGNAEASQTADWMFKTGKNIIESEKKAVGSRTPVPE